MADTIMAMLIASASVEINMVSPFACFLDRFACSTPQPGFWLHLAAIIFVPAVSCVSRSTIG